MLKKSGLILFLLAAMSLPARGQGAFEKEIRMKYSSIGNSVTQTTDGNFIVGCQVGRRMSLGAYFVPVIIKINESGVVWSKPVNSGYGLVDAVAASSDGGCFITCDYPSDVDFIPVTLTKVNENGITLWNDELANIGLWRINKIIAKNDGGCILGISYYPTGQYGGVMWIDANGKIELNAKLHADSLTRAELLSITEIKNGNVISTADVLYHNSSSNHPEVIAFSSVGKFLWERQLDSNIQLLGIDKTSNGGFTVCGVMYGKKYGEADAVISTFDSAGNFLWGNSIHLTAPSNFSSIVEAFNGDLIAVGTKGDNALISRIDKSGTIISMKEISIPRTKVYITECIRTIDNGIAITGFLGDTGGVAIFKLDSNLNGCHVQDILQFDSKPIAKPTDTTIFTVSNDTISYETFTGDIGRDSVAYSVTDLCSLSSVSQSISEKNSISVFPNPISSKEPLNISISGGLPFGHYTLSLLDLLGNRIKSAKIELTGAKQDLSFDVSECAAGMYFIELQNEKGVVARAKFVKE